MSGQFDTLTAAGCREVVSSLRDAQTHLARRYSDAMTRLTEAEVEAHALGQMMAGVACAVDVLVGRAEELERAKESAPDQETSG